ncbi:ACP S-malonyltransferase [Streptomyces triticiradicis]|uniref:Malonyl CoA-acyl carrier protein transacylase n=1 Tax=Streptomyces triticiradicis TaxID=2651189 RepID=A0A7J5DPY7_9ACTN|nr:ACP S-malonyltransferase [Streptomyces triticiradicis]KAB1990816.1 ACP S-malonyltransferase [Streptomyces triticiradicis]
MSQESSPRTAPRTEAVPFGVGLLFPGQGAQRPGMGEPWRDTPHWKVVTRLSEVSGRDLGQLLLDAGAERLARADAAQLATFTMEMVVLDALRMVVGDLRPAVCAGHSLGEYAALTAAGVLDAEDGVRLVAERGAAMEEADRLAPGTMTVLVGTGIVPRAQRLAARMRAERRAQVWVANINGAEQVVVSGTVEAVAALVDEAERDGARALRIPVGGAFHTPLMAPAAPRLAAAVDRTPLHPARCPVIANVDARAHLHDQERWRALMLRQLVMPVRWAGSMRTLTAMARGHLRVVEAGPGSVLANLARRTLPEGIPVRSVSTPAQVEALAAEWWR